VGRCDGQAPGNEPQHAGALVFFKYDSAGTRTILRQSLEYRMPVDEYMGDLFVSADGSIRYGIGHIYPAGTTFRDGVRFIDPSDGTVRAGGSVATTERDCPACGHRPNAIGEDQHLTWGDGLAVLSRNGDSLWYRPRAIQTAVIDSVEGTVWTGRLFRAGRFAMVESSSLVLAGVYWNNYKSACKERDTYAAFIGKYSSKGDRIWFQEYATESSVRSSTYGAGPTVLSVVPLGADYAVFMAGGSGDVREGRSGGYMFKIKGSDGTLLP
jgi:hypothetical protein